MLPIPDFEKVFFPGNFQKYFLKRNVLADSWRLTCFSLQSPPKNYRGRISAVIRAIL